MVDKIDTQLHLKNEAQFLCFTLEDEQEGLNQLYAINVFKVREIIYYDDPLTETAGDDSGVLLGLMSVRDAAIPLVDMRRWLHYNEEEPLRDLSQYSIRDNRNLVVICNFSNTLVGLKIKKVHRILQRNWNDVNVENGFGGDSKAVATTKYTDGSVVQILDVEKMVSDMFPSSDLELDLEEIGPIKSPHMVLIAEDSRAAVKRLEMIIKKLELNHLVFPNGKALLDYLHNAGAANNVGAVITDLEMPEISGFEVLKRIRENPAISKMPVIINSSMSSDSNLQMAHALKADAFITKSNPVEIERALKSLLKA